MNKMREHSFMNWNHLSFEDGAVEMSWLCSNRSIGTETISGQNCFLYHRHGMAHIWYAALLHLSSHWIYYEYVIKRKQAELVALLRWNYPFIWTEIVVCLFICLNVWAAWNLSRLRRRRSKGLKTQRKTTTILVNIHLYI